jgi:hypothetical protein
MSRNAAGIEMEIEPEVYMTQVLINPEQSEAVKMHRELGPFEHLLWLVDQWTPRDFALVSRIEGSPVSVESLTAALLESQHRHPILRSTIRVNLDGGLEFIPTSLPIWLRVIRRTNNTQWLHDVETQLALRSNRVIDRGSAQCWYKVMLYRN